MAFKNYQIFINGQLVREVKNLETSIEKIVKLERIIFASKIGKNLGVKKFYK